MAPRALLMLTTCCSVPLPAKEENAHGSEKRRRRWTGEIKRKILAATRRPRIWAVGEEEPCDVDVEKQRAQAQAPKPKVPEQQATSSRREGAPVSQSDRCPSDDDGAVAVDGRISAAPVEPEPEPRFPTGVLAVDGRRRKRKEGLRVRFDLPPEDTSAAPVEPRFPTGVLGEPPPESFARLGGADITSAFLVSVVAEKSRGTDSAMHMHIVDRDLVACWTERKAACSRRLSYLRDYCPFQREEEEDDEDEESELETTTTRPGPEAEPCHAEVRPVKTGLPFDSLESEAEFVKAIRSRYLHRDDFLLRHAHERSREQKQSLMGRQ